MVTNPDGLWVYGMFIKFGFVTTLFDQTIGITDADLASYSCYLIVGYVTHFNKMVTVCDMDRSTRP